MKIKNKFKKYIIQLLLKEEIIDEYIEFLYDSFLKRKPDEIGRKSYLNYFQENGLQGFKDVLENLLISNEKKNINIKIYDEYIEFLYFSLLKRKPDEIGRKSYLNYFQENGLQGFKDVLENVLISPESKMKGNLDLLQQKIIDEYIDSLYETFLKRKPDAEGRKNYLNFFKQSGLEGFKEVLINLEKSEEYKSSIVDSNLNLEKNNEFHFEKLNDIMISSLFEKTAFFWRNSGSEPSNIYWSVISSAELKKELNSKEKDNFLETGKNEVDRIKEICEIVDFDFNNCKEFLDYGCGVGRIAVNLPSSIKKVNCVDFSLAHLKETEFNIDNFSEIKNFSSFYINCFSDLKKLPQNQDIIHSFIVLQHNTPPVIERTVEILLNLLSRGGIAILHIPITIKNYKFDPNIYLEDDNSGTTMELHILPKANIFKLAKRNNCKIVYSFCDGGVGGETYSEIIVFQKEK